MKREAKILDGTPEKRLFWSIIQDYDLETSICELTDNALDLYLRGKRATPVFIRIDLDIDRQLIRIEDNAGGVRESELELLVRPGGTGNSRDRDGIGYFGVGSKRAVVALGENTTILSRYNAEKSYRIDIDYDWLKVESWEIPAYTVDPISERTTIVEVSKLRTPLTSADEGILRQHLSMTYARYLASRKINISLNGTTVTPITFDKWAYPPKFLPRDFKFDLKTSEGERVVCEMVGGLVREKVAGGDDYGVYFYCNDRLIAKELKDREVGYISGKAGIPHSDAALCRVIVSLRGAVKEMPWNSTKSAIVYSHATFRALQDGLIQLVAEYSSLSRRLRGSWTTEVFEHKAGKPLELKVRDPQEIKKSHLPPLPTVIKRRIDHLRESNLLIMKDQPWTVGLVEAIAAVDLIRRQKFQTKNRIALLLLDSSLEIALKEFVIHADGLNGAVKNLENLFRTRSAVVTVVRKKVNIDSMTVRKIEHYYRLRNKLVHERATVDVTDDDIDNYAETVQHVLTMLFSLHF
jgi:hypothetical protein